MATSDRQLILEARYLAFDVLWTMLDAKVTGEPLRAARAIYSALSDLHSVAWVTN